MIKYYSIHFNRPDFVKIQFELSKLVGYDLVIVNNGGNKEIKNICENLNIEHIETVDNSSSGASYSHGNSINQLMKKINFSENWGIIDHDIFIVEKIEINDFEILSWQQKNVKDSPYLWPGFLICKSGVNLSDINFLPKTDIPGDTGSGTNKILNNYKIKWVDTSITWEELSKGGYQTKDIIVDFSIDDRIVAYHYLNGSNWVNNVNNTSKNKKIFEILKKISDNK
jgi:hypothetical protein